jgi:hypothetical protein
MTGEPIVFPEAQKREQIDQDIQQRIEIHQANIARLAAARASAVALNVAVANRPLVMLAIGDSWFDYPLTGNGLPLVDTDVIAQLRRIGDMPPTILNLAHHGFASTDEMALPKQEKIIEVILDKQNWLNGKPDAILISAGGNDIAGERFCIFLDFNDGKTPGLNQNRFQKALGMVEACYLDCFEKSYRSGGAYFYPLLRFSYPQWRAPDLCGSMAQAISRFLQLACGPGQKDRSRSAHCFPRNAGAADERSAK